VPSPWKGNRRRENTHIYAAGRGEIDETYNLPCQPNTYIYTAQAKKAKEKKHTEHNGIKRERGRERR